MKPSEIDLHASATNGRAQRVVVAVGAGGELHRDKIDTHSATSRKRFFTRLADKTSIPAEDLVAELDHRLVAEADEADARAEAEAEKAGGRQDQDGARGKSQATMLVELALDAELWHTLDGDAYATVPVEEHAETWPVRSRGFRRWLARRYFTAAGSSANSQATNDALTTIEGKAIFDGAEQEVSVRLAEHDGAMYLDLANGDWQAVKITTAGWTVIDNPPVRFRRAKAMKPMPRPVQGGAVHNLRAFINTADEDWPLVAAWLLAAMRPAGPFPVLCLHGEQGSAKSTTARVLRGLVDPNTAPLRCEPRDPRDLMIAANNGWVIALDNLSRLPVWLSDAICRLSTGGGFSTRTLYENDEETIFDAMRPVVITGINEVATRGDLLDRALMVNLPRIPEHRRRQERDFWRDFEGAQPAIFGAMLTALSEALRKMPSTKMEKLPRMADFAHWATAGEAALGIKPGGFLVAYTGNREASNELAIESSPAGKAVVKLMATSTYWTGTATELLADLERLVDEKTQRLRSWPRTGQSLSGTLRRLATNLRALGIEVDFGHTGRGKGKRRGITLQKAADSTVPTVPIDPKTGEQGPGGDDGDADSPDGDATGTQEGHGVAPCQTGAGTHGDDGDARLQPLSDGAPF